jgi:hypothetical protein
VSALRRQLERRPVDARRVGWKVGRGDRERIGGEIVVGHLTDATMLEPGAVYEGGGDDLRADSEVALKVGADGEIVGYGVAVELVDLAEPGDAEDVVAANVFHRAVAFGPTQALPPHGAEGALLVDGERRASAEVQEDFAATVAAVACLLAGVDERLEPGDRIITGSVVQVPVAPGERVAAEIGGVGSVEVSVG